jgi:hypothetical protein
MKKILAILLVGIFVVSIPTGSAMFFPRKIKNDPISTTDIPEWADGNITGVYALKNESGYVILGNVFGYYHRTFQYYGYYAGMWESLDGTQTGYFQGIFIGRLAIGQFNDTITGDTGNFFSLFRMNETDYTITAVALVYAIDDYDIRYSLCTYTEFE